MAIEGHGAAIHIGCGPDLIMGFGDVDSLERQAAVADNGARQLRAGPDLTDDCR